MNVEFAKNEILNYFRNGEIKEGTTKLSELARLTNQDYDRKIDQLRRKWLGFENAVHLRVFTQSQAVDMMTTAAGTLLNDVHGVLRRQGISEIKPELLNLSISNVSTLTKKRETDVGANDNLYVGAESEYGCEHSTENENIEKGERPVVLGFMVIVGILLSTYLLGVTFLSGINSLSGNQTMMHLVLQSVMLILYLGIWRMLRAAVYIYTVTYIFSLLIVFYSEVISIYDVFNTIFAVVVIIFAKKMK